MRLCLVTVWASPFIWTKHYDSMLSLERPKEARDYLSRMQPLEVGFKRGTGWSPARRHQDGCEKALAWGADLILILGSDQVYEPDLLCRLIDRWNEGYEVVSAMVPTRGHVPHVKMRPFQPVAYRIPHNTDGSTKLQQFDDLEQYVQIIDPKDGDMQQIHFIGSGVLLFHRDHLKALSRPWFYETVHHETQMRMACMDTKFVWRLQTEAGARVWVDTTIKVKHLHDMEIDDTFQWRFEDWATRGVGDAAICPGGKES